VETWLMDLVRLLDRRAWQFDFCTLGPQPGRYASRAEALRCRVRTCPRGPGFAKRLYTLVGDGYDIVHSHVHHFSAVVLAVARAAGAPVRIAHSHNTSDGHNTAVVRRTYRAAAGAGLRGAATHGLACTAAAAAALFGTAWRRRRIGVLPYGTAPPPEPPAGLRGQLGLDGAPVAGHAGRFEPQKNHRFLLDVAACVHLLRPDVRWLLAGDGPLRPEMEARARALGLRDVVSFSGLREDVPALMTGVMDAFVLPSLWEGLPVALLEAQSAGLPVLASTAVPPEAAVSADAVEFLPLASGPKVWADRLLARLARGRLPLGQAASQMTAAGFTIEQSLERLLEYYTCALRSR
jgi:glycosyltransferase involved in cell wall biosynthesis